MKKLFLLSPFFVPATRKWHCTCSDAMYLPHGGWFIPACLFNISLVEFVKLLITEYHAEITPYMKEGNLDWLSYTWSEENSKYMSNFKNKCNLLARQQKITI